MPKGKKKAAPETRPYRHEGVTAPMRPEAGTQAQFKKRKPPAAYRYDSSLAPALEWDENPARPLGEWLLARIEEAAKLPPPHVFPEPVELKNSAGQAVATVVSLEDATAQLRRLGAPFLNWAGRAERPSFSVPTLPLFIHERLSTQAVIETLQGHRVGQAHTQTDLFADPQRPVADQVLKAYEYRDGWVNRMILGDSLQVMNSLLHYEQMAGQVQMIYMDPPYGINYGSNFQPFVRKRDVKHGDDDDLSREPETVRAYRDTWELGLHSYLAYLRDRLLLARDLLHPSGSIFVQISAHNLHHVREIMDQVLGVENYCALIFFLKTTGKGSETIDSSGDYIVWYAKQRDVLKSRQLFRQRKASTIEDAYSMLECANGTCRYLTTSEKADAAEMPKDARRFMPSSIYSDSGGGQHQDHTNLRA